MKLINASYEILEQAPDLQGIYEQIERVGKTCYKSEVKGGETAKNFVDRMIANQHFAMLEHGTVYLEYPQDEDYVKYHENPYSRIHLLPNGYFAVTTNLRVLVENGWMGDLKFLCGPTEYHLRRACVRFICDRGVSHELVRHRVFSFAQESTRYCNYSKDRFDNEITFIKPSWCPDYDETDWDALLHALYESEKSYFTLLNKGFIPQQARQVLPNALKTEVCMTGFIDEAGWKHFFDLRALDKTGPAHPDMKNLALPLYEDFKSRGWI